MCRQYPALACTASVLWIILHQAMKTSLYVSMLVHSSGILPVNVQQAFQVLLFAEDTVMLFGFSAQSAT